MSDLQEFKLPIKTIGVIVLAFIGLWTRIELVLSDIRARSSDRWTASAMVKWVNDTKELNNYSWKPADVRTIQKELRDSTVESSSEKPIVANK